MRAVHYLNQFFGGLGGEEHAGTALEIRDGAAGPGKLLEQLFGSECQVVMTLVCGDNYAVENQEVLTATVLEKVRAARADLFVAGPCFLAGRYGMASGALCAAVQSKLDIPVITAMAGENPGADLYRQFMYIIDSGDNGAKMRDVLTRMAALAQKLIRHQTVGSPKDDGYLARGLIRDEFVDQTAGQRLVDMVLKKVRGELTLLIKDIYFAPLGYDDGTQMNTQHSHNHISLEKGGTTEFEGAKITFTNFNLGAETMQAMSEGKDFQMGAVLEIEKDGKKTETELLRKQTDGKVEFTSFESKEMNLKIGLENLSAGVIDIALSSLDGSETQTTTTQTETNEVLSVSAKHTTFC